MGAVRTLAGVLSRFFSRLAAGPTSGDGIVRVAGGDGAAAAGTPLPPDGVATAQRPVLEDCREVGQWLSALVDSSPDAICIKDEAGRWQQANDTMLRLFHLQGVAFRGLTDTQLAGHTHPLFGRHLNACGVSDERAWRRGEPLREEETVPSPDGGERTFEVLKVPLFTAAGARRGLLVLGRDITGRKQAEQARLASEQRYRALFDSTQDAVLVLSDGMVLECNPAAVELFGRAREALEGSTLADLSLPAQAQDRPAGALLAERFDAVLHGRGQSFSWRLAGPGGGVLETEMRLSGFELYGKDYLVAAIRDQGERLRAEERLRLAAAVFEHSHEGVLITDAGGRIQDVNRAFTRITGFAREEVLGRLPDLGFEDLQPNALFQSIPRLVFPDGHWQGEVQARRKDGELYTQWLTVSAVQDETGRVRHYVGLFSDISELVDAREEARFLAQHDRLTGLPNRSLFMDRIAHELARAARQGGMVSLMYLDLDGFKEVNDRFGHAAGDALLVEVADRLRTNTRAMDTVARLGGDELTIVMPDLQRPDDAERAARKLVAAVARPYRLEAGEATVTASLGVALYPGDGSDVDSLLRKADDAMYAAKAAGRNGYRFAATGGIG